MIQITRAVVLLCAASAALLSCVDRQGVAITLPRDGSADGPMGDGDASVDAFPADAPGDSAPLLQLPPMNAIHGNGRLICAAGDGAIYFKRSDEPWSAVTLPSRTNQGEIEQISWKGVFCPWADRIIAVGFGAADMEPKRGRVIELALPLSAPPTLQVSSFESLLEAVHGNNAGDTVVAVGSAIASVVATEAGVVTRLDVGVWSAVSIGDFPAHQGLLDVWVTETQEQIAVGKQGLVLQRGTSGDWASLMPGSSQDLRGVWSESNGKRVFAVGRGTVLQREGFVWTASGEPSADWNAVSGKEVDTLSVVAAGKHALAVSKGSGWNEFTNVAGLDLPKSDLRGVWISENTGRGYLVGSYDQVGGSQSGLLAECDGLTDADLSFAPSCTLLSRP